jgi:transcriptional regulator with XRE-family HTH domain
VGDTDKGRSAKQVEFGDRVLVQRHRLGLSQGALAHPAGINRTYIASSEAGQRNPSLELMAWLALALKVDLGDLLSG